MKLSEMKQAVELLSKEWDLGKVSAKAKGNVCAWIYLLEILEETETMVIEKDNGKLIGFCGYAKWKLKKHIILDKNYRGRGLGKKMLQQIFEFAKEDDVKCLQILTDESCNFKFYESLGCKKVYEKTIPNGEPNKCGNTTSEQGYIRKEIKFLENHIILLQS